MELRHLRYFQAVAEELHFGRAAGRLNIEQPPLSRQIKQLERDLGVDLLQRTTRKVRLTVYGSYLKQECDRLFQQLSLIRNNLRSMKLGTYGWVRIGYVGAVMHSLLPRVLPELRRQLPSVHTVLTELTTDEQVKALLSGELDIGIVRTPLALDSLVMTPLHSETFSVVVWAGHELAGKGSIALPDLKDEPFISFSRACGPGLVDTILSICNRHGFSPRVVHETSQLNTILRLVENRMGYSIVPTSVQSGYNIDVEFCELDECPERSELAMLTRPDRETETTQQVIELIKAFDFDRAPVNS